MEWYHVYLFVKLDDIAKFIDNMSVLLILLSIFSSVLTIFLFVEEKCNWWKAIAPQFILILLTLFITTLHTLLPSTKQIAAIYLIPKIVNNEKVQAISGNALEIVNNKFAEWVEDSKKSLPKLVDETKSKVEKEIKK